jgi:Xaa-Pro aminopeptidase
MIDGYHSDMTRTVWFGDLNQDLAHLYQSVLAANAAGVATVAQGAIYADVDRACREVLQSNGYPATMAHPAGHNIGLYIHELPYFEESVHDALSAGQIVTVEPGVYIPGLGGARVEDMLLVTPTGNETLSIIPKKSA